MSKKLQREFLNRQIVHNIPLRVVRSLDGCDEWPADFKRPVCLQEKYVSYIINYSSTNTFIYFLPIIFDCLHNLQVKSGFAGLEQKLFGSCCCSGLIVMFFDLLVFCQIKSFVPNCTKNKPSAWKTRVRDSWGSLYLLMQIHQSQN